MLMNKRVIAWMLVIALPQVPSVWAENQGPIVLEPTEPMAMTVAEAENPPAAAAVVAQRNLVEQARTRFLKPANHQAPIGPPQQSLPLYRLYDPVADRHLYTVSSDERDALIGAGWKAEGTPGSLLRDPAPGLLALYRLYDPNSQGHFLTTSEVERNALVQLGWTPEGVVGYLHPTGVSGSIPLYRLYRHDSGGRGRHLYTALLGERDALLATGQWRDEGVVGYMVLPPEAPSGLMAGTVSSSAITLSWVGNSTPVTGFQVYRSLDGVDFEWIGSTRSDVRMFKDPGLAANRMYHYKVQAVNAAGGSADSNVLLARTALGSLYGINGLWTDDPLNSESDRNEIANSTGHVAVDLVWEEWDMGGQSPLSGFDEKDYEKYETEHGTEYFKVNHRVDEEIKFYSARGIKVLGKLFGTPPRFRGLGSLPAARSLYHAPTEEGLDHFSRFAGMLARRYNGALGNGTIANYEIGNEVNRADGYNVGGYHGDTPIDTQRWVNSYADFFKAAYDAIQINQPTAKVFVSLDHAFSPLQWDRPTRDGRGEPSLSTQTFLKEFAARMEGRTWRVAYHPYNTDLFSLTSGPNDAALSGTVTLGNIGLLPGWLRESFPNNPEVYGDIMLTESGFHSGLPGSEPTQAEPTQAELDQADALSNSFRNVLGTPGITGYIYQRMMDHPNEGGLLLGLRHMSGKAKPAWSTWTRMNQPASLNSGFELLPFTRITRGYHPEEGHRASSRLLPTGFVEEMSWKLLRTPSPTHAMRMLYESGIGTHSFLSMDYASEGQEPRGPVGYVYTQYAQGLVPLYSSYIPANGDRLKGDHFITSDSTGEGWGVEQLLGYAYPSDATAPFLESDPSALLVIPDPVTRLNPPPALAAPSRLKADVVSSSQIHLSWADNSSNETGFKVYRSLDGVSFEWIGTTGAGIHRFSDTGLAEKTLYRYKVRAFNAASDSVDFNTLSVRTPQTPPAAPSRLTADVVSSSQIHLSWWVDDSSAKTNIAFTVERSLDGVVFSFPVFTRVPFMTDTGLAVDTLYYYRVRALYPVSVFPSIYTDYSNIISARTRSGASSSARSARASGGSYGRLRRFQSAQYPSSFPRKRLRGFGPHGSLPSRPIPDRVGDDIEGEDDAFVR